MAVYFIRDTVTGFVKIGLANEPWRRLSQIQTGCPTKLEMAVIIPGGADEEARQHALFAEHHERGEWFREAGSLRDFIASMPQETKRKKYKNAKAELIDRLRAATGAPFPTCSSWVERGSIPGCWWLAISEAGIWTLEEMAERSDIRKAA